MMHHGGKKPDMRPGSGISITQTSHVRGRTHVRAEGLHAERERVSANGESQTERSQEGDPHKGRNYGKSSHAGQCVTAARGHGAPLHGETSQRNLTDKDATKKRHLINVVMPSCRSTEAPRPAIPARAYACVPWSKLKSGVSGRRPRVRLSTYPHRGSVLRTRRTVLSYFCQGPRIGEPKAGQGRKLNNVDSSGDLAINRHRRDQPALAHGTAARPGRMQAKDLSLPNPRPLHRLRGKPAPMRFLPALSPCPCKSSHTIYGHSPIRVIELVRRASCTVLRP